MNTVIHLVASAVRAAEGAHEEYVKHGWTLTFGGEVRAPSVAEIAYAYIILAIVACQTDRLAAVGHLAAQATDAGDGRKVVMFLLSEEEEHEPGSDGFTSAAEMFAAQEQAEALRSLLPPPSVN